MGPHHGRQRSRGMPEVACTARRPQAPTHPVAALLWMLDRPGSAPKILAPFVPHHAAAVRRHPHVPLVTAQELIDAGVHYGHQASRWNPKMKPYIHGKRHKIHILSLEETIKGLYRATHFLRQLAATGAQILFLGTKKQIRVVVENEAKKSGMPAVTERWIG